MATSTASLTLTRAAVVAAALCLSAAAAGAQNPQPGKLGPLEEMSTDRWAKLKEAERFQLKSAERLYLASQWKAAADEYEKFLKLYEKSDGASYSQLMWSHCHLYMRKQNTAIKDGFQSLLDYFPESPEAPLASLLIGRTYRDIGDLKPAKKAYTKLITDHPKHFTAVMARLDLVDIAAKDNDLQTRTNLLRELTYEVERKGPAAQPCAAAALQYCHLLFRAGNFDEGLKALATVYSEASLPAHLVHPQQGALLQITSGLTGSTDEATKKLGEKLADAGAAWLKTRVAEGLKDPKTKPQAVQAWYAVADLRAAARQPDKQKAVYEEMLAALGADDAILGQLAAWYKANKQRDLARATYAKYKDATQGQAMIADSFEEEKQFDRAIQIYQTLAAGDQKAAPRWMSAIASAYRASGKPDAALQVYDDLLKADPMKAADYHFAKAETMYQFGRWKDCITAYRGTDRFPTNYQRMAYAYRQLGKASKSPKEFEEAIGLYRQIIVTSPGATSASLLQIAYTQEEAAAATGDEKKWKEAAIATLKQICDKHPKSGEGSTAHARLNEVYKIQVTLGGAKD